MEIKPIARIETDFKTKFGIPRQSGRVKAEGIIIFEKEYQNPDYIKELNQFSHIWLIWEFSENTKHNNNATVRPPRLGGNTRIGVFASRSPFRPNNLGLSCVKLKEIKNTSTGCVLVVEGADLMNGTPIYDIKPYIPYTDCIKNAVGGFAEIKSDYSLEVEIPALLIDKIPEDKRQPLLGLLKDDPRPAYQNDSKRIYGFFYADFEIKFKVKDKKLTVTSINKKAE